MIQERRLDALRGVSELTPLLLGAGVGISIYAWGSLTVAAIGAAVAFGAGALHPSGFLRTFLRSVAALLLGYAFLGKGFAYLGLAPFYVGEIVLGVGLISALLCRRLGPLKRSPVFWLLLAYMGWGALCTFPYLQTYELDALRDAVLWSYGAYAMVVAVALLRTGWWNRIPDAYASVTPWLMIWLPLGAALSSLGVLPVLPGTDVPIAALKPGDVGVQLAGIASFLLLDPTHRSSRATRVPHWLWWCLLSGGFLVVASSNRGGMLAFLAALGVAAWFRRPSRWLGPVLAVAIVGVGATAVNLEVDIRGNRPVSPAQIATNVASIFEERGPGAGTREWRMKWWGEIVDYTIRGEYFWSGRGFGVNLADLGGRQARGDGSLRSPHNGHMTILARTGVPGFVLWISGQGALGFLLARAALRARRRGDPQWAAFFAWVLATWVAFLVNSAFDVFLEGPQGGIPFWCLVGLGIALVAVDGERRRTRAAAAVGLARPASEEPR